MEAKPKYAKPRSLSVLMALRILFLLGFLFGCLFARTSQIAMAPVSGSVWFRGPFETGTDFPFVFSAFLFDSLFYALPIFLFGMTFLGVLVIPAAIILKGFTLGTSLTALIRLEGIGSYYSASALGGVSYAYANYDSSYTNAYIGVRLAFKTSELAAYCGRQFLDIWADFVFLPEEKSE